MKLKIYIKTLGIALGVMLFSGCDNWLDGPTGVGVERGSDVRYRTRVYGCSVRGVR